MRVNGIPNCVGWVIGFVLICVTLATAAQAQKTLRNTDVIALIKQGLAATVVESVIRTSPTNFDISSAALIRLTKSGVPESVIALMVEQTKTQQSEKATVTSESGEVKLQAGKSSAPKQTDVLGPKRAGTVRIGIVTTEALVPLEQDEAIRAQFYEILYGNRASSTSQAVLLKEKLDRNISSEAMLTKCDYLLFISLDSTIRSGEEKRGNFIQKGVRTAAEALGAAAKMSPLANFAGITYRSYQLADSLATSTTLLETVTQATKKKDRIGINFKLVDVRRNREVIAPTKKEIVAKKDKEPILQNVLIQLGNEILNGMSTRP